MADEETQLPAVEELLDFDRESVQRLYATSMGGINPERWERARDEVRFEDVVSELTGHREHLLHCPFHGKDRTPSFQLYPRTNDAFCFGCPPGSQYYDSVIFASKYLDCNRVQALHWIEKTFDLPRLPDSPLEDDDEPGTLGFWDLSEPFILKAAHDVQEGKDPELAEDYIRIYFISLALEKSARASEDPDGARLRAAMGLASVLGKDRVAAIAGSRT
jgi:hypothetical protein